jgi:hypothetical protein
MRDAALEKSCDENDHIVDIASLAQATIALEVIARARRLRIRTIQIFMRSRA